MSDAQEALPNPNPSGTEYSPEESVPVDPESVARHYEVDDVDFRNVLRFGGAILAGVGLIGLVLWIVVRNWVGQPLPVEVQISPALVTPPAVPGPGLDADPEENLDEMLQRQNEWLSSYGWLDRDGGVVHIPIDRAMQLLVEQSPAAREGPAPDFRVQSAFRMDGSGGVAPAGGGNTGAVVAPAGVVTSSVAVTSTGVVSSSGGLTGSKSVTTTAGITSGASVTTSPEVSPAGVVTESTPVTVSSSLTSAGGD